MPSMMPFAIEGAAPSTITNRIAFGLRMNNTIASVFFFKQKTAYEIRPCDWSSDECSSDLDPGSTLRQVGFVSWGGILCLFGCAAAFGWLAHLDVLRLLDAVAIAGLGGQAVARIGCFTYGCCYGRPRDRKSVV